jgi:hypothetical protein
VADFSIGEACSGRADSDQAAAQALTGGGSHATSTEPRAAAAEMRRLEAAVLDASRAVGARVALTRRNSSPSADDISAQAAAQRDIERVQREPEAARSRSSKRERRRVRRRSEKKKNNSPD